jgi:hypothetical protein
LSVAVFSGDIDQVTKFFGGDAEVVEALVCKTSLSGFESRRYLHPFHANHLRDRFGDNHPLPAELDGISVLPLNFPHPLRRGWSDLVLASLTPLCARR